MTQANCKKLGKSGYANVDWESGKRCKYIK